MATRSERDRSKGLQEKHQAILSQLLKEEDNKYCVDCDAKGPRWGSWNLGVFLCIRCAGIHRNLGVHISKVKSVNLDTWTPEQLGMVQEMGNSRARAVYEANLPDHFRRPQTDSRTLEAFIRAKYEQKKYIAKEWVPPHPKVPMPDAVDEKKEKKKARPRPTSNAPNFQLSGPKQSSKKPTASGMPASIVLSKAAPPQAKKKDSNIDDLIGLESSVTALTSASNDIFSDFISASTEPTAPALSDTADAPSGSDGLETSLFGGCGQAGSSEPPKSTKDSIMALFGSIPQQPQPQPQQNFGVSAGMFINQQGGQQPMPNMQMAGAIPGGTTPGGAMPVSMPGAMPNGMQNGMMAGGNMMNTNVGMMANNNMMAAQGMQGPMMMGAISGVPAMQTGQVMAGQGMPAQMGQIAPPSYSVAATQGLFSMQPQPAPVANQQFQQLANQMAGMPMGVQTVGGFPAGGGIAAGGSGGTGGMWGAPQPGQTLSTNLWQ